MIKLVGVYHHKESSGKLNNCTKIGRSLRGQTVKLFMRKLRTLENRQFVSNGDLTKCLHFDKRIIKSYETVDVF